MPPPVYTRSQVLHQREWSLAKAATPEGVTLDDLVAQFGLYHGLARKRMDTLVRRGEAHYARIGRAVRWFATAEQAKAWAAANGGTTEVGTSTVLEGSEAEPPTTSVAGPRMPVTFVVILPDKPLPIRPGAEDHRQYPSRMGNTLHYPDGRVERIAA